MIPCPVRVIKEIRNSWGLTQAEFAALLGVNVRTFQDWEQERFPTPDSVQAHIQTLEKLRSIQQSWNELAKSWDQLFPGLPRN